MEWITSDLVTRYSIAHWNIVYINISYTSDIREATHKMGKQIKTNNLKHKSKQNR